MESWTETENNLPPEGLVVKTKIHDGQGRRNEQRLCRSGSLWWFEDGSMYVYYIPTHWTYAQ